MEHSFDVADAVEHGVECAVILRNLRFWLDKNKANNKHIIEDRVWTYNSATAFSKLFPYLTPTQVRRRLKSLEDKGVLIVANHNLQNYDKTNWYSLSDQSYHMLQNRHIDATELQHRCDEIEEPIPYNKPYNKPYSKLTSENSHEFVGQDEISKEKLTSSKGQEKTLSKVPRKVFPQEVLDCYEAVVKFFPEHLTPKSEKKKASWLDTIDKLHRIDDIPYHVIVEITKQVRQDHFWQSNFLSLTKLRKKKDDIMYIVIWFEKFKPKSIQKAQQQISAYQANSNPNDLI